MLGRARLTLRHFRTEAEGHLPDIGPLHPMGIEMSRQTKVDLARRLRLVREELYGEYGGPLMAVFLGISHLSWAEYESGEVIPGPVLLKVIEQTRVSPRWLLTGDGPRYSIPERV